MLVDDVLGHDHQTNRTTLTVTGRGRDEAAANVDAARRTASLVQRIEAFGTTAAVAVEPDPVPDPADTHVSLADAGVNAAQGREAYMAQVERCRRKLCDFPQASVRLADAGEPSGEFYDAVCCYFLLHEIPADYKRKVVDALLGSVVPGGKVIFVDYHKPHFAHPLKVVSSLVFDTLEPFAKELWRNEIAEFASAADGFVWRKQTCFGGLFQKVIASKPAV